MSCDSAWLLASLTIILNYKNSDPQVKHTFFKNVLIELELNVGLQKSEAVSLREQWFNKSNAIYNKMNHFP